MSTTTSPIAVVGGGVIGAGWAARFLLHGHDVNVHDPSPQSRKTIAATVGRARTFLPQLYAHPLPPAGRLQFCNHLADAVEKAHYIQESVPEQQALKWQTYDEIERYAAPDAIIASSTSGFTPSTLLRSMRYPQRLIVAHPFHPVYLLPLVEVAAGDRCAATTVEGATRLLTAVGMHPLHIRKEIDAHIADRLMEALWREALWLVKEQYATTADIDDAIRYSFGLRWAQMGLFETFRIAGGDKGMSHFLAQFGPALKWPWSRLIDVPDLDQALIERITAQSDAQSGGRSVADLEQQRDTNLVGIMRVLKKNRWGAGAVLNDFDARLACSRPGTSDCQPCALIQVVVKDSWLDYNGHMTESRYLQIFGKATDAFLLLIGMDEDYRRTSGSFFTLESHLRHLKECQFNDQLTVTTQLVGSDDKRLHLAHQMRKGAQVVATGEHLLIHVGAASRKGAPIRDPVRSRLATVLRQHQRLPRPEFCGAAIDHQR